MTQQTYNIEDIDALSAIIDSTGSSQSRAARILSWFRENYPDGIVEMVVMDEAERSSLMTPSEVAAAFSVDVKTVARWAKQGKIESVKTLGGHRRFKREVVESLTKARIEQH